jgi:hypothetical protein
MGSYYQKYQKYKAKYLEFLHVGGFKNSQDVNYIAVFLDPSQQQRLRYWWESTVGEVMETPFIHHLTVMYNPDDNNISEYDGRYGTEFELRVTRWASSDSLQCQAVQVETGIESNNKFPHITVATNGNTKAVVSNQLLEAASTNSPEVDTGPVDDFVLTGRLGKFVKKPGNYGYIDYNN